MVVDTVGERDICRMWQQQFANLYNFIECSKDKQRLMNRINTLDSTTYSTIDATDVIDANAIKRAVDIILYPIYYPILYNTIYTNNISTALDVPKRTFAILYVSVIGLTRCYKTSFLHLVNFP